MDQRAIVKNILKRRFAAAKRGIDSENVNTVIDLPIDRVRNYTYKHPESYNGFSLLQLAIEIGDAELFDFLIEKGADVNLLTKQPHHTRPLHYAIDFNRIGFIRTLVEQGADVNAVAALHYTPLHQVAKNYYDAATSSKMIDLLLAKGASINARDYLGRTPEELAAAFQNQTVVDLLPARTGPTRSRSRRLTRTRSSSSVSVSGRSSYRKTRRS
jgi:ankyrin repeat protein